MVKIEQSNGTISITNEVFTNLAGDAATSCFGVKGMVGRSKDSGPFQLLRRESMSKGVNATFADDGIVAVRHAADEAIRAGNGGHAAHVLFVVTTSSALAVVLTVVLKSVASVARAKADVAADRIGKQERILRDDADLRSQRGEQPVARVDAVDEHTTGGWVVETGDKVDESRFAGAGFAEDSEFRACGNVEVDVAEHRRPQIVGESEVDVLEVDGSCDSSRFIGGLLLAYLAYRLA